MIDEKAYASIWIVTEPSEQALAPDWMSFHIYKEAQRCPLSVSLQRASYSQLWNGYGYPGRPSAAAMSGMVVHDAAEAVLKKLVEAGVTSLMHPDAMPVLRDLGGFTKILETSLQTVFARHTANPRFAQVRNELLRTLKQKLPQMRATLQALLVNHVWTLSVKNPKVGGSGSIHPSHDSSEKRSALGVGTFVEVGLEDASLRWKGRVDIIEINNDGCAITDLKSGSSSKEHEEQLLVYTMLWREDNDRNPSHLPVLSLTIVYADKKVAVAVPEETAIKTFRRDLMSSSELVRQALNSPVVPARPSLDNCRFCSVKLLCQAYWDSLTAFGLDGFLSNNQVSLLEPRGERAWLATITASPTLPIGAEVLIRNYEDGKPFWGEMKPGLAVRLTDGLISAVDDNEIPVINLSMMSEALFIK